MICTKKLVLRKMIDKGKEISMHKLHSKGADLRRIF